MRRLKTILLLLITSIFIFSCNPDPKFSQSEKDIGTFNVKKDLKDQRVIDVNQSGATYFLITYNKVNTDIKEVKVSKDLFYLYKAAILKNDTGLLNISEEIENIDLLD